MEIVRTVTKPVQVSHAEAFQLMLYRADDGCELWFWNSRDGVTPFITVVDGKEYMHAMRKYLERHSAVIPVEASHVWVSYDRESWKAVMEDRYERVITMPEHSERVKRQYPTVEEWLESNPFVWGQPRQLTREEFLETTPEHMGRTTAQL